MLMQAPLSSSPTSEAHHQTVYKDKVKAAWGASRVQAKPEGGALHGGREEGEGVTHLRGLIKIKNPPQEKSHH